MKTKISLLSIALLTIICASAAGLEILKYSVGGSAGLDPGVVVKVTGDDAVGLCGEGQDPLGIIVNYEEEGPDRFYLVASAGLTEGVIIDGGASAISAGDTLVPASGGRVQSLADDSDGRVVGIALESGAPGSSIKIMVNIESGTGSAGEPNQSITTGAGLTGAESGDDGNVTVDVGEGWGIAASATEVSVDQTDLDSRYLTSYTENDPQVGTISNNYVPKWNGSALVTGSIYDNGDVGIGTSDPDKQFDVRGQLGVASSGEGEFLFIKPETAGEISVKYSSSGKLHFSPSPDYDPSMSESAVLTLTGGRRIGIREAAPAAELDIDGKARSNSTIAGDHDRTLTTKDYVDDLLEPVTLQNAYDGGNTILMNSSDNILINGFDGNHSGDPIFKIIVPDDDLTLDGHYKGFMVSPDSLPLNGSFLVYKYDDNIDDNADAIPTMNTIINDQNGAPRNITGESSTAPWGSMGAADYGLIGVRSNVSMDWSSTGDDFPAIGGLFYAENADNASPMIGCYGWARDNANTNFAAGVLGATYGTTSSNYAIYGYAHNSSAWAGYFKGDVNITGDLTVDGSAPGGYWDQSGSDLYPASSGWRVGIGTTTPDEDLHIYDSGDNTRVKIESSTGYDQLIRFDQVGSQKGAVGYDDSGDVITLSYGSLSNNHLVVESTGKVGIGTDSPAAPFHVQSSGGGEIARFSSYSYGNPTVSIGTESSAPGLGYISLYQASGPTELVKITSHASNPSFFNGGGNVGIGTDSPSKKLDVNGDISLESGSGSYYSSDGSQGWTGSFTNGDGNTVTVKDGIITNVGPSATVFITSTTHNGNFGGSLSNADDFCQSCADAAGLSGTWTAWLSRFGGPSAADRVSHRTDGYYLPDGTKVADNWTDLTDGTLDHAIDVTEYGTSIDITAIEVATGTRTNGNAYGGDDGRFCYNWSSTSGWCYGHEESRSGTDWHWTTDSEDDCFTAGCGGPNDCGGAMHFYCFKDEGSRRRPSSEIDRSDTGAEEIIFDETDKRIVGSNPDWKSFSTITVKPGNWLIDAVCDYQIDIPAEGSRVEIRLYEESEERVLTRKVATLKSAESVGNFSPTAVIEVESGSREISLQYRVLDSESSVIMENARIIDRRID